MRPWWRWFAETAECALICGHNRVAVEASETLLASDPRDLSDVRFTLAYALAKLEDGPALDRLIARYPSFRLGRAANDAWTLLSQAALAHKRYDLDEAAGFISRLLAAYPGGSTALVQQVEIGDGLFARIRVPAYSEDELVVALSEGIVLLQEGVERTGKGVFGAWVASTTERLASRDEKDAAPGQFPREGGRP